MSKKIVKHNHTAPSYNNPNIFDSLNKKFCQKYNIINARPSNIFDNAYAYSPNKAKALNMLAVNHLKEKGDLETFKSIKKKDRIVIDDVILNDDINAYAKSSWYSIVPPLEKGVVVNTKGKWYTVFEILAINSEDKKLYLDITVYTIDRHGIDPVYSGKDGLKFEFSSNVIITYNNEGEHLSYKNNFVWLQSADTKILESIEPSEILGGMDEKWFKEVILESMKIADKDFRTSDEFRDRCNKYMESFIVSIIDTNYKLSQVERVKTDKSSKKIIPVFDENNVEKERVQYMRTYNDGLKIYSEKVVKDSPTTQCRHYKVSDWKRRGHVRRYKAADGSIRETYVRPANCHRHGMKSKQEVQAIVDPTIA